MVIGHRLAERSRNRIVGNGRGGPGRQHCSRGQDKGPTDSTCSSPVARQGEMQCIRAPWHSVSLLP